MRQAANIIHVGHADLQASFGGGWARMAGMAGLGARLGLREQLILFLPLNQLGKWPRARQTLARLAPWSITMLPRLPLRRLPPLDAWSRRWEAVILRFIAKPQRNVIFHAHGPRAALVAAAARRNSQIKVIFDVHGIAEEGTYQNSSKYFNYYQQLLRQQEAKALQNADKIITVSRAMLAHLREAHTLPLLDAIVIPCATDPGPLLREHERNREREERKFQERLVLTYLGGIETYQKIPETFEFFAAIFAKMADVVLWCITPDADRLRKWVVNGHWDHLPIFIESVNPEKVKHILPAGDVGILLRDSSPINRVSSPVKFAEYCAAGLPVITTPWVGDYSDCVRNNNLGFIVKQWPPRNDEFLLHFLNNVKNNRHFFAQHLQNYAKNHFFWNVFANKLSAVYDIKNFCIKNI